MKSPQINFSDYDYIYISCEGTAEEFIINKLLDNDDLKFKKDVLFDKRIHRKRNASKIESQLDGIDFGNLLILRIIDNPKSDKFKLKKPIKYENIVTAPEIEMILIYYFNFEREFNKTNNTSPSAFMKKKLNCDVKNKHFLSKNLSNDYNNEKLICAIKKVKRKKGSFTIADLLKK